MLSRSGRGRRLTALVGAAVFGVSCVVLLDFALPGGIFDINGSLGFDDHAVNQGRWIGVMLAACCAWLCVSCVRALTTRPYGCPTCGKRFAFRDDWNRHRRRKHRMLRVSAARAEAQYDLAASALEAPEPAAHGEPAPDRR